MQEDLENLLSTLDKSVHGAETGSLTKAEVHSALESFFAVGQQGGKTANRFDELMQVISLYCTRLKEVQIVEEAFCTST